MDFDAQAGQIACRHPRQVRAHRPDEAVDALHQDDAGVDRVDHAVVAPERPPGELAQLARHLNARRAAADDDEGHEAPALLRIGLRLGQLERAEDLAPQRQSVVEGLHAAGGGAELVVAEIGARGPAGDDEAVVADGERLAEFVDVDLAGLGIDVLHLAEDHAQRRVVPQHVADGGCDLALGEDAGGHLVEERLKEVVVGPVDQGDADGRPLEGAGSEEPPEAGPDDDHMVPPVAAHGSRSTTIWT